MDVGAWLRGLGLAQYEEAFAQNEIDATVLADVTADDLKEIGVASVGHRRKILAAAAQLSASAGAAPPPSAPAATDAAERRQLTVMFCDLVGSTALSARLDPEDMRQVIRAYQDACSGVVARYDGFVAKFMGDGILAYFGFPHAHEDDAARAVHAGLEIAEVVTGLQTPARAKLAARIGVATGLVVVGDLVGQGSAQEQAVVGDTPNLAARLQGLAEPGSVVLAAATRRLLGDGFRLRNIGRHEVKGLAEPVEAWTALGVSESESRFEATHATRLSALVGREVESADLKERQRRAWAGQGQIVLISGEAGIGKSRISAWLAEQVAETPHTRLRYQCSPYHRDSALHPFVRQFERAAGIAPQESPEIKLDKLEKVLGLATDRMNEIAPLIASMLSIPSGRRYPPLALSPAQQRRQTLSALIDQMEGLARKQPVLMLFEDVHWADATTLEVLDLAIERARGLPVLCMITYRPEFEAPWKGPDIAAIALHRLDRAQAETLVERVTGGRKLPAEVMAQIVAKTDGVPLFVEELTKNVLESGLLIEAGERYRLDGPLPPLAIPSTLQDSLMARLDRLAAVKEIAQIGAAIGREFSYGLLQAVVDRDEATLRAALAQLEDSELVFRSGEPPTARYTFKHALVQDTAYESLLKSRRQILHRRIAETLRDKFADVAEAEPELLAHHFTQAGLTQPAIEYWGKAGDLALRRSAFKEAIAHLSKAIEMTEREGGGEAENTDGKLRLQVSYGNALIAARGPGASETKAAFEQARVTAVATEGGPERFSVAYGLWIGCVIRSELGPMRELAESFLRDVATHPDSAEAGVAQRINGVTHWFAGEFEMALPFLERALVIFDPARDRDLAFRFGQDAGVAVKFYLAVTLWPLGDVGRARATIEEMAARADQLDQMAATVTACGHAAIFEYLRGDLAGADAHGERLGEIARRHDIPMIHKLLVMLLDGWRECRAGDHATGLARMHQAIKVSREQHQLFLGSFVASMVARAESESGEFETALATLDTALTESAHNGHRWLDAEIYRLRGETLLAQTPPDPATAEVAFQTAIAVAKSQKARSFELRATLALAKHYHATGRDADAHAALGPALEGFTPTSEFGEIEEAQTLLDALARSDEVTAARQQRIKLHVAYGNALIAARGYGAPETTDAFARARIAGNPGNGAREHFSVTYGLWVGGYMRGELAAMREHARAFLRDVEKQPRSPEAGVAHRINGVTSWFVGDFVEARGHYEKALAIFDSSRDADLAYRFGHDAGVGAMSYRAQTLWPLGEIGGAVRSLKDAKDRVSQVTHIGTIAFAMMGEAVFEMIRGDFARAASYAGPLAALAREHDLKLWGAFAVFLDGLAARADHDLGAGRAQMRRAIALLQDQKVVIFDGLWKAALAAAEAQAGDYLAALETVEQAISQSERTGQRWFDAELHRTRGKILLEQDASNLAPAEDAFLTAIAIAQRQNARSFELRAALSLAKLYHAASRNAATHAALGPALEGFTPTPEFSEIEEAQTLFDALARSDEVKTATAARQQRVKLHVAFGNALIGARGYGAPETTAAFARAREAAAQDKDAPEHFSVLYGLWVGGYMRGDLAAMRAHAASFLHDVETLSRSPEAGVAHRINGITSWFVGEFGEARGHYEKALAVFDPSRDADLEFRFGHDAGVGAMAYLALALWPLGEVDGAARSMEASKARASELTHTGTIAYGKMHAAMFEMMRGDFARATLFASALAHLAREHDLKLWRAFGVFFEGWIASRNNHPEAGLAQMRRGFAQLQEQNVVIFDGLMKAAFAVAEAQAEDYLAALAALDDAASRSERNGQHWFDAELHRTRGEILLEQDASNPVPAEEAFLAAIATAQAQKARSFELRAALSLAKLYRATGRDAEGRAALGLALEGFSPTPEFSDVAEAQALLTAVGADARS